MCGDDSVASGSQTARRPSANTRASDLWHAAGVTARHDLAAGAHTAAIMPEPSALEVGLSVLEVLDHAPPRTRHIPSIVRSSPLAPPCGPCSNDGSSAPCTTP